MSGKTHKKSVVLELSEQFLLHHKLQPSITQARIVVAACVAVCVLGCRSDGRLSKNKQGIFCCSNADDGPEQVNLWNPLLNLTYNCNTGSDLVFLSVTLLQYKPRCMVVAPVHRDLSTSFVDDAVDN